MKAVFQNTMFCLLCLASVVWAAPTQTVSLPGSLQDKYTGACSKISYLTQDQSVKTELAATATPSVLDGEARFACW